MINRKHNCPEDVMKLWLQTAKKNKCVHVLYKTDNALKNTPGYEQGGLIKLMEQWNRNGQGTKDKMPYQIDFLKTRFKKISLRRTEIINYWYETVK